MCVVERWKILTNFRHERCVDCLSTKMFRHEKRLNYKVVDHDEIYNFCTNLISI
jgi:hypothetical protein